MLHDRHRHDPHEPELFSELRRACCICKRVVQRDGAWVEEVLPPWTPVTHGLCLPCFERMFGPA